MKDAERNVIEAVCQEIVAANMTPAQASLLCRLDREGGAMSVGQIAEEWGFAPSVALTVALAMADKGLVSVTAEVAAPRANKARLIAARWVQLSSFGAETLAEMARRMAKNAVAMSRAKKGGRQ